MMFNNTQIDISKDMLNIFILGVFDLIKRHSGSSYDNRSGNLKTF